MLTRVRSGRWTTGLAAVVSTLVIASALPATAATTLVEGTNRAGGTVTVSNDHAVLGDTLTVTGSGFTADPDSGSSGQPVLAVKLNDSEYDGTFPWGFSGPSALDPSQLTGSSGSDGFAAIGIEDDGTFEVQFTVPTDWDELGTNNFRFLGGSQTTGDKRLPIQSFSTQFAVLRPTQGFAQVTSTAHAQDSVNTSKVAVSLRNFRQGDDGLGDPQKVGVRLDGTRDLIACLEPDADGDLDATVTLPSKDVVNLGAGKHNMTFLAGTACVSGVAPTQGPPKSVIAKFSVATNDISSTAHHPGGSVTTELTGFMNVAGSNGQKVALKITGEGYESGVTCVVTDGFGKATGTAALPADLALGTYTLNALAGNACGEGGDAPGRSLQATFEVTEAPLAATTAAKVTGNATVDQTLRATAPAWSKQTSSATIQWLRNGAAIKGATGTSYKLVPADQGKRISVRYTATAGSETASTTSPATAAVKLGTIGVKKKAKVKGKKTVKVGKKLTTKKATFKVKGVKVKYQWLRNGKAIKKAKKASYKTVRADKGKKIRVRITYTKPGYKKIKQNTNVVRVR